MSFLGFFIEQGQLKPDLDKIWAVVDWPVNPKELQGFLGFAYFYFDILF